jgi:predicted transcriptional regulator
MTLEIIENPIYGQMTLETAAWSTPFTWVDRTAAIVEGVNYAQGGRVGLPGQSQTDVGTLNTTFKDLVSPPVVGDLVRFRRTGTTEYAWVGYVQDVSQRVVFDQSVSYTTPIVLTTINCLDWVGYVSQFQAIGVGGLSSSTFVPEDNYTFGSRVRALNNIIDPTNATAMITATGSGATAIIGDTDMVGTFSDHLDLLAFSDNRYWYANNVLPTNKTTGRTGLVTIRTLASAPASGKTFTDQLGSAGQLHYVEIDLESSSQNVANTIVLNNNAIITTTSPTAPSYNTALITQVGGANRQNFKIVNNEEVVAVPYEKTWQQSDSTSITTYGNRATQISTNLAGLVTGTNLASNPSAEYSDTGYNGVAVTKVARRKPAEASTPFTAFTGEWSVRMRQISANSTGTIQFNGAETDGTPIISGNTYYAKVRALRGSPSRANYRAQIVIRWLDDSETVVSSATGSNVILSTANVWYELTVSGVAPASASRARINVIFSRSDGSNMVVGDYCWTDALQFSEDNIGYFDGDTQSDSSYVYLWTGEVGLSPSFRLTNNLDDTANIYLSRYATTSNRVTRIRWNAQEDLPSVSALAVGSTVQVVFDGTTTTHRIVGVDGNVSPERYMIDYYLEKV